MVVVFPAPFRPRKPKMLPAGTSRSRPAQRWLPLEGFAESPRFNHPVTHGFLPMPFPRDAAPVRFQKVF